MKNNKIIPFRTKQGAIHSDITVIQLFSDNFNGDYLTPEAYNEVRLQMSTGDFHTHKVLHLTVRDIALLGVSLDDIIDLETLQKDYI